MCNHELLTKIYDTVCKSDHAFHLETTDAEKNSVNHFYFRQVKLGEGKIIYCNVAHSRSVENWFNNEKSLIFGILSSENNLYLAGRCFFDIWDLYTEEKELPKNIWLLHKWIWSKNAQIKNIAFKTYYDNLDAPEIPASKHLLITLCKQQARRILLSRNPVPDVLETYPGALLNEHEYMSILCGLWEFNAAVNAKLSARKDADIATKSRNNKVMEYIRSKEVCEPWELRIAEALRSFDGKRVTAEFTVGDISKTCKIDPNMILEHLAEKKRFCQYDSQNIEAIIQTLVAKSGKKDLSLFCRDISKITCGRKVLYEAQAEDSAQNEEGSDNE